jgi:hypothetical protein
VRIQAWGFGQKNQRITGRPPPVVRHFERVICGIFSGYHAHGGSNGMNESSFFRLTPRSIGGSGRMASTFGATTSCQLWATVPGSLRFSHAHQDHCDNLCNHAVVKHVVPVVQRPNLRIFLPFPCFITRITLSCPVCVSLSCSTLVCKVWRGVTRPS